MGLEAQSVEMYRGIGITGQLNAISSAGHSGRVGRAQLSFMESTRETKMGFCRCAASFPTMSLRS